jgi:hypothetical protein
LAGIAEKTAAKEQGCPGTRIAFCAYGLILIKPPGLFKGNVVKASPNPAGTALRQDSGIIGLFNKYAVNNGKPAYSQNKWR